MNITQIVHRSQGAQALRKFVIGVLGGAVATGPMTVAMIGLHRLLRLQDKQPLPPREITTKLVDAIGARDAVGETGISTLTLLNHFAYGSASGAVYTLFVSRPGHQPLRKGILFGLLLWAFSYLGLLPGMHILKPATQHSPRRSFLMIFVHLIWSVVLSIFVKVLVEETTRSHSALVGGSVLPHVEAS